jgi:hypothetical protein
MAFLLFKEKAFLTIEKIEFEKYRKSFRNKGILRLLKLSNFIKRKHNHKN